MLRKSACFVLFAMIAIHSAADLGVGRPDLSFSPPDCPQGMAAPHHKSDVDLYGTISAIEGPQPRPVSCLVLDVPRSMRINGLSGGFLDCHTSVPPASHSQFNLTPLRI
jgi:hypothetical protein